ncbi:MAG: hypothetical protein ABSA11_06330 [Candidatus Bathyarchaeia archaeon]
MSHLVCPLCGKYAALSTLNPDAIDLDLKVISFRSLGRPKGFAKGESYSILGDTEITPIIANRVAQLYNMFINSGNLVDISGSIIDELKRELSNRDFKISLLNNEIKVKNKQFEEISLRSHVDYIILESLSLPKSEKLDFDGDNYYMVITKETLALNIFLYNLVQEIPNRLKMLLLKHINWDKNPDYYHLMIENASVKKTVADELMGDSFMYTRSYSNGVEPYTLKSDDLKSIVKSIKERISNPELEMQRILKKMERFAGKK